MTREEWQNLNIGDRVFCNASRYAIDLRVVEICEDKTLEKWRSKYSGDFFRLCKFENENGFHTWDCDYNRWDFFPI
jgi:hypothetical protein